MKRLVLALALTCAVSGTVLAVTSRPTGSLHLRHPHRKLRALQRRDSDHLSLAR